MYKVKILNLEIDDIHRRIINLQRSQQFLTEFLKSSVSQDIFSDFMNFQSCFLKNYGLKLINNSIKKYNNMKSNFYVDNNDNSIYQFNVNEKWIKNLSKVTIPKNVLYFLSLGKNFFTNNVNKSDLINNTLCNVEQKLDLVSDEHKDEIRSHISVKLQDLHFAFK